MAHSDRPRHIVISADCHAGPRTAGDYRPYVDPAFREAFDAWVEGEEKATRNDSEGLAD